MQDFLAQMSNHNTTLYSHDEVVNIKKVFVNDHVGNTYTGKDVDVEVHLL